MDMGTLANAVWGAVFIIVIPIVLLRRARGRRGREPRRGVGSAAAGTIYDWLNQDKQKAVDIIVEGQAEARRPEYPDGNLPDLESPDKPR